MLISHKREWNNAICNNMNRPRDYDTILSEASQTEKDNYHTVSLICRI